MELCGQNITMGLWEACPFTWALYSRLLQSLKITYGRTSHCRFWKSLINSATSWMWSISHTRSLTALHSRRVLTKKQALMRWALSLKPKFPGSEWDAKTARRPPSPFASQVAWLHFTSSSGRFYFPMQLNRVREIIICLMSLTHCNKIKNM